MNKPDAIDIAVRDGMEALIESGAVKSLEKTGRAFCPVRASWSPVEKWKVERGLRDERKAEVDEEAGAPGQVSYL